MLRGETSGEMCRDGLQAEIMVNEVHKGSRVLTVIERQALDWVALLVSGKATVEDRVSLEHWLDRSSGHSEAFSEAVLLVRMTRRHQFPGSEQFRPAVWERPTTRRAALGSLAAVVSGVAILHPPLGLWPSWAELSSDYRTGVGERREIIPVQGVTLALNTRTSVALKSAANRPSVALIGGEVAATVGSAAVTRFTVITGDVTTSADQGSFDVRYTGNDICVTCAQGTVDVEGRGWRRTLAPGQQVTVSASEIGKTTTVDPIVVTAWRQGQLVFYDARLETVVDEVNRYRPGKILVARRELAKRRFNATFRIDRIENVVADLERLANVSATQLPGGVVVLS
jgi:transmembrane sensor